MRRYLTLALQTCLGASILTPLVVNPAAYYDAYFSPKWAWLASLAVLGVAALVARAFFGRPMRFPLDPIWPTAVAFLAVHYVSIAWSRSPSLALERCLNLTWLTAILWLMLHVVRSRRQLLAMAWLWIGAASAIALWTLHQDFQRAWPGWPGESKIVANLPDWRGYLAAGLGNTNHIGDLLALAMLPTLVLLGEARRLRAIAAALAAAVVLAAALTVAWSVGSNLGLLAGGLPMLTLVLRREGWRFFRRRRRWIALIVLWAGMLTFYLADHPANPHAPGLWRKGFASQRWKEGGPTRLAIWGGTLEIVREHPWLGAGAGNFTYVYPEMKSPLVAARPELHRYQGAWTNAAHNLFLQAWAETGVVGLFLLLALILAAFHSLLSGIRFAPRAEFLPRMTLAGLLAAYIAQGMMNFALQHPTGALVFYFLLGAVAVERSARRARGVMPSLVMDKGSVRFQVDWETMKKPTAVGAAFRLSPSAAGVMAVVILGGALTAIPVLWRPVRAETAYARAVRYRQLGDPAMEERFLRRTLEIDPWATGARSRYSEFLVRQGRPAEALEQLEIVRQRLNSTELFEREARAWTQLNETEKARRAYNQYVERLRPAGR